MRLIDHSSSERAEIFGHSPAAAARPTMVFLGGLLHVQDIDTGPGFTRYLQKLRGTADARILMPLDTTGRDTNAIEEQMFAYGKGDDTPCTFAREIYDHFYADLVSGADLDNAAAIANLKQKLSDISLVGYSYGTNLIQQIGACMVSDLRRKTAANDQAGLQIYDICSHIKAVCIGPVGRYHHVNAAGDISQLHYDDPYFDDALTIFSQMSFMMRDDKIIQKSYGREPLGALAESSLGVEVRNTHSTSLFIDYIGKPIHKAAGYTVLPSGLTFAKIITNYDFMLHDLRSYVNVQEKQGTLALSPTLAIAPALREATETMLVPDTPGTQWRKNLQDKYATPEGRENLATSYRESDRSFFGLINQYEQSNYTDGIELLQNYVAGKGMPSKPRAFVRPAGWTPDNQ